MKFRSCPWKKIEETDEPHLTFEDSITESLGYRTAEQQIKGLLMAGERLEAFRKGIYSEELSRPTYSDFDDDYRSFENGISEYEFNKMEQETAEKEQAEKVEKEFEKKEEDEEKDT